MFHGVVWSRLEMYFIFFRLKSSNGFHVETHIFERSFIFFILFAGTAAEITSPIFRFNAANVDIFPVQRRYFSV